MQREVKEDQVINLVTINNESSEFDRKLINRLQYLNDDLTVKLSHALSNYYEQVFKTERAENNYAMLKELVAKKTRENNKLIEQLEKLESDHSNYIKFKQETDEEIDRLHKFISDKENECIKLEAELNNLKENFREKEEGLLAEIKKINDLRKKEISKKKCRPTK